MRIMRCIAGAALVGFQLASSILALRQLYVIEATQKPSLVPRKLARNGNTMPKRILYIDAEAW